MNAENSEPTQHQPANKEELSNGVHIREQDRDVMVYAVFDGSERVSEVYSPVEDLECIQFARGYSKAKERYINNDD